jgi:hypothetical protein
MKIGEATPTNRHPRLPSTGWAVPRLAPEKLCRYYSCQRCSSCSKVGGKNIINHPATARPPFVILFFFRSLSTCSTISLQQALPTVSFYCLSLMRSRAWSISLGITDWIVRRLQIHVHICFLAEFMPLSWLRTLLSYALSLHNSVSIQIISHNSK